MIASDCRIIERDFNPAKGNVGRGVLIPWGEFSTLVGISGYEPYAVFEGDKRGVPVYSSNGIPTSRMWKGFFRRDAATGQHYIVGFESDAPKGE